MLKIGEFARVAQVSIATLRHYEKVGLLKPAALDPETGYRYYTLDQLPRVNRLLALKELGLSLEQIARCLEEDLSLEHLREMFTLKQAQTQQMLAREQARLTRIAARLRQIEQEGKMPIYEVLLKDVEALLVASLRGVVPLVGGLEQFYSQITTCLDQQGVQPTAPPVFLLHSRSEQREDGLYIDGETAVPLATSLPKDTPISMRTLPGGLMACSIHAGPGLFLGQAYAAIASWIQENEYRMIGPARQVRLRYGASMDMVHSITELQFPIARQETRSADRLR